MCSKIQLYHTINLSSMVTDPYIFILLGNRFEETIVTIFVTELRKAGLRVRVVGIQGPHTIGNYGLKFSADITLGQALPLADHAVCVVIPYNSKDAKQIGYDPRVHSFFSQARANNALFIIGQSNLSELENLELIRLSNDQVVICPDVEELIPMAREIAVSLSNTITHVTR